ncbi:MAG: hypothetical protein MJB14_09160 [Spirochaetes bacterium]|nr:hypothetical protein [Spirochaetota bacterium]
MKKKLLIIFLAYIFLSKILISEEFVEEGLFLFSYPKEKIHLIYVGKEGNYLSKEKYNLHVSVDDLTKWESDRITVLFT